MKLTYWCDLNSLSYKKKNSKKCDLRESLKPRLHSKIRLVPLSRHTPLQLQNHNCSCCTWKQIQCAERIMCYIHPVTT